MALTYNIKCEHSVNLDQSMEVSENNGYREEQEIGWITNVVANQFDELAQKHPREETSERSCLPITAP